MTEINDCDVIARYSNKASRRIKTLTAMNHHPRVATVERVALAPRDQDTNVIFLD